MSTTSRRLLLAAGAVSVGAALFVIGLPDSHAGDHVDSPLGTNDPVSDLTDVYAFMRPGAGTPHAVFVMNVRPGATAAADAAANTRFSDKVIYTFRIQRVKTLTPLALEPTDYRINCSFANSEPLQVVTCNIPLLGPKFSVAETVSGTAEDPVRLFAGVRSDPAFYDRNALVASQNDRTLRFMGSGTNYAQGKNVLSIVVEVDPALVFNLNDAGSATPILAVAGETTRKGPQ